MADEIIAIELDIGLGNQTEKNYQKVIGFQTQIKDQVLTLREENKKLQKELREQSKEAVELRRRAAEGDQTAINSLETLAKKRATVVEQIVQNENAIKNLGREQRRLANDFRAVDEAEDAYGRLKAQVQSLRESVRQRLALDIEVPQEDINRLEQLDQKVRDIDTATRNTKANVGNYRESLEGLGVTVEGLIPGLGGATEGITSFLSKAGTAGGIVTGVVAALGALVKFLADTTIGFERLNAQVERQTGTTGEAADRLTVQTQALANTFNQDFTQILDAANVVTKELTGNFDESTKAIETLALALPDEKLAENIEQLEEYSTQINLAGGDIDFFTEALVRANEAGFFGDKFVDAIKEGRIQITEQTDAVVSAVTDALGEDFADRIFTQVNEGVLAPIDALKEIAQAAQTEGVPLREYQALVSTLFTGAGEDAGAQFFSVLQEVDGNLDGLIDTTDAYTQTQLKLLDANTRVAQAQADIANRFEGTFTSIEVLTSQFQAFLLEALNGLLDIFQPLLDSFGDLFPTLADGTEQTTIFSSIVDFLVGALTVIVNVASRVVDGITGIVQSFQDATDEGTILGNTIDFINSFYESLIGILSRVPAFVNGVIEVLGDLGQAIRTLDFSDVDIAGSFERGFDAAVKFREEQEKNREERKKEQQEEEQNAQTEAERQRRLAESNARIRESIQKNVEERKAEVGSVEQLNEEISRLQELIRTTGPNAEVLAPLVNQLDETQKRLQQTKALIDSLSGGQVAVNFDDLSNSEITGQLQTLFDSFNQANAGGEIITDEQLQSALDRIEVLRIRRTQAAREATTDEQEFERIAQRFRLDSEIQALEARRLAEREGSVERLEIEEQIAQRRVQLNQSAQAEIEAQRQEEFQRRVEDIEREKLERINSLDAQLTAGILTSKEYADQRKEIQREAEIEILQTRLSTLESGSMQYAQVERQLADIRVEAQREANDKIEFDWESTLDSLEQATGAIFQIAGSFNDIFAANDEERIASLEERKEKELALAEGNAEEQEKIEERFAKEQEKIEKQAFERTKRLQAAQATIEYFVGLVRILGNGDITGVTQALQTAALTAQYIASLASINGQEFAKGTVLDGPSHENGGIGIVGRSGHYYGEAEGGEMITTKGTSRNPRSKGVISFVNQMFGGDNLGGQRPPRSVQSAIQEYISGRIGSPAPSLGNYRPPSAAVFQAGTVINRPLTTSGTVRIDVEPIAAAIQQGLSSATLQVDVRDISESLGTFNQDQQAAFNS
jgi:hypothetical protein